MVRSGVVILAVAMGLSACEGAPPERPQPASLEDGDRCFANQDWNCAAANYNGYLQTYPDDPAVKFALEELEFFSREVKVFGSYPASPFRDKIREPAAHLGLRPGE